MTRDTGGSVEIPVPYHPLPVYLCHTQCKHRKKRSRTSLQTKIFKKSKTAKKKKKKNKKKGGGWVGGNQHGVTQKWVSLCCEKEWQTVTYIRDWSIVCGIIVLCVILRSRLKKSFRTLRSLCWQLKASSPYQYEGIVRSVSVFNQASFID